MSDVPSSFYYIVGILVVGNIGAIISFIIASLKFTWYMSGRLTEIETKVDIVIHKHEKDLHAAHMKIRELQTRV